MKSRSHTATGVPNRSRWLGWPNDNSGTRPPTVVVYP